MKTVTTFAFLAALALGTAVSANNEARQNYFYYFGAPCAAPCATPCAVPCPTPCEPVCAPVCPPPCPCPCPEIRGIFG